MCSVKLIPKLFFYCLLLLGKVICFILVSSVLLICRMSLIFVCWPYTHQCLFKCCSLTFNVCLLFFLGFVLMGHWPFYFCPSNFFSFCLGFHPSLAINSSLRLSQRVSRPALHLLILVFIFSLTHTSSSYPNLNLIAHDRDQPSSGSLPQTLTHKMASSMSTLLNALLSSIVCHTAADKTICRWWEWRSYNETDDTKLIRGYN